MSGYNSYDWVSHSPLQGRLLSGLVPLPRVSSCLQIWTFEKDMFFLNV